MGTCSSLPFYGEGYSSYEQNSQEPYKLSPSLSPPSTKRSEHYPGGLVGLTNLGNTCFMNSALQCLSNTPPIMQYFLYTKWREELNPSNPIGFGGHIASSFGELLALLWSQEENDNVSSLSPGNGVVNSNACIAPRAFKSTVGRYFNQFSGYDQHDAQELLVFLLDGLHEDLNRVKKKPYIEDEDNDENVDIFELADRSWANYLLRNRSIIVDMAQGQLRSTLTCLKCGHISVKFDPYMHLSIPVNKNSKNKCSLLDCINEFSKPELLSGDSQWRCPKCKEFRNATKTMSVWSYPPILIIHLKRFHVGNQGSRRKIDTLVEFPVETPLSLEVKRSSSVKSITTSGSKFGRYNYNDDTNIGGSEGSVENVMYSLYSVCNHYGSLYGGHYTAYANNCDNGRWYSYNDSTVDEIKDPASTVCSSGAYVLFFKMEGVDFSHINIATEFRSRSSSNKTTVASSNSSSSLNSISNGNRDYTHNGRLIISGNASVDPLALRIQLESNDSIGVRNAQYTPTKKSSSIGKIFSGRLFTRIAGVFARPLPNVSPPHSQIKPLEDKDNNEADISRMVGSMDEKNISGGNSNNVKHSESSFEHNNIEVTL